MGLWALESIYLPFEDLTFLASKCGGKEAQHYHFQRLTSEEGKGQVALGREYFPGALIPDVLGYNTKGFLPGSLRSCSPAPTI